jgi:hypothetical protein
MSENIRTCGCTTQQYSPIIYNTVGYQDAANTVYESKRAQVAAAAAGTLGVLGNGQATFKSNAERMQYLLGRQNRGNSGAGCGVAKKTFAK